MPEPRINDLLAAATTAARWMRQWLDDDLCDCEGDHICGRTERERELQAIEKVIQSHQVKNASNH